jgi:hypothetical protein
VTKPDPTKLCEAILHAEIAHNEEHDCLVSETAVARRLLARSLEMAPAYAELHTKLGHLECGLKVFLGLILSIAGFWNRNANAQARADRRRLKAVNAEIANAAALVAQLLTERDTLHNHSGFYSSTHYHTLEVIDAAADHNYLFRTYLREPLGALRGQFDLKYWPSLSDVMRVIALDADAAIIEASDEITKAATSGPRNGLADVARAIFAAIEERKSGNPVQLPPHFRLTDCTLATFLNCMLDLDADEIVGADFVKGVRQRERRRGKATV